MVHPYQDSYTISFEHLNDMLNYHSKLAALSRWERTEVNNLKVEPLDEKSPFYNDLSSFHPDVMEDTVKDTASNLGLAIWLTNHHYPVRDTAFKSLLDRAKIGGTSIPKLPRNVLANTLNECLAIQKSAMALLLVREQKVSAVHSGDERDYSILPIDKLLEGIKSKLNQRFSGNTFDGGYSDHALTSASWSLPSQTDDLLGSYHKTLAAQGKAALATKLTPGIRFSTSDTGVASAKVSALLLGLSYPIQIGGMVATEHRGKTTVEDFTNSLDMLFSQFEDSVRRLESLAAVYLEHPVNAMTAVCKKLSLPKKQALEAIAMFDMAYGGNTATAHDVYFAMQEVMFMLKTENSPVSKMLILEESMARALTLSWTQYDYAKAVIW